MLTAATGDTILLAFNMAWAGKHVYTRIQQFFRQKRNMKILRPFNIEEDIVTRLCAMTQNYGMISNCAYNPTLFYYQILERVRV